MLPLLTPRLRLEPVTTVLADAARAGAREFQQTLGAQAPSDWCAGNLDLVAKSAPVDMHPMRAVAIHREDGEVVGDVRFELLPYGRIRVAREFEIGYSVARARRQRGYAVEATQAVIDWLFAEAGAEAVWAGCEARNVASARTLMRLGFQLDSTPGKTFWWVLSADSHLSTRA
jgi:RimJ/RimL family protein N-acetyltransferase